MRVVSFGHGQNPILGRVLLGNWICGARGLRGGAWWELDELAVNESILKVRRGRTVLGTWGGKRLRRKGGFQVRIEARLAVWGAIIAEDDTRMQSSGSLGVKEPALAAWCDSSRCGAWLRAASVEEDRESGRRQVLPHRGGTPQGGVIWLPTVGR